MTPDRLKTLGRYEILQELGRGAMGVVYLARDPIIGRQVALKVLRLPAMAGEEEQEQFRRRFIREAQSAGILAHPNIVTIHDVAEGEDGQPTFIAMEYIQGTDLKELLRPGKPLDLPFVHDVVRQIAQGLEFAHSQGVVHRDVKPANILITAEGQVKITDFGIARIDTSNLTQDTQLLGTPNYMAPEQIQGIDTDHRVDIFALGVMVYEMTTGQKPFQGENVTEVTHRIVYEDHRAATERVPELPEGLDEVLERALAKKPGDRYERASELSEDLAAATQLSRDRENLNATQVVEPAPARAESSTGAMRLGGLGDLTETLEGVWQSLKSPRGLALGVAVALLLAIGIGGAALWMGMRDRTAVEEAPPEPPSDPRVENLVREGHRLLANGDPQSALETFRDAERLAPDQEDVRSWRELAERQAEAFERWSERERQLGRRLASGQLALTDGRFQEALTEVEAALELADDEESVAQAEEIRRLAEEGIRQREERQAAKRRAAAEEERRRLKEREEARKQAAAAAEPLRPAEPVEDSPPVVAADPTLEMEFISDQPLGTLTIFVGEDRFVDETFRFIEKRGFLGLGGEAYRGRLYLEPQAVPPGKHMVRVYVTPRGQAALAKILDAVEFAPGDSHRLEIQLTEAGGVTAKLR